MSEQHPDPILAEVGGDIIETIEFVQGELEKHRKLGQSASAIMARVDVPSWWTGRLPDPESVARKEALCAHAMRVAIRPHGVVFNVVSRIFKKEVHVYVFCCPTPPELAAQMRMSFSAS